MKTITVREFLRGGYQHVDQPMLVSRRGALLFTVMPHRDKLKRELEAAKPIAGEKNG